MRRGFSLLEVMVVVSLAAILLAVGFSALRGSNRTKAQAQALAQVVVEELRAARQRAVAQHMPVAVVFPSGGGTRGNASSLAVLEGEERPRITRVLDFSEEYPGATVFVGTWGLDATKLSVPTATNRRDRPATSTEALDVGAWLPGGMRDFAFVFAPDGSLWTNDLPNFDGAYHLVVAAGVDYALGGPPPGAPSVPSPPPYPVLSQAGQPFTVTITPAGAISLRGGVTAADASVSVEEVASVPPPAPPLAYSGTGNASPVVDDVRVLPQPNGATLPPGVDSIVPPGGHLTLEVDAHDPDGDRLTCQWRATGPAGKIGTFSATAQELPCDYQGGWTSRWEWRPPPNAAVGEVYRLECTLSDSRGATVVASGAGLIDLEIRNEGWIVYASWRMNYGYDICRTRPDGSGFQRLTDDAAVVPGAWGQVDPYLSEDGSKIVYTCDDDGDLEIFIMNADGSGVRQLTNNTDWDAAPSLSPNGDKIIWTNDPDDWPGPIPGQLWVMDSDGSNPQPLGGWEGYHAMFSPDGTRIAYVHTAPANYFDIFVANADGTGTPVCLTDDFPNGDNNPRWSPDGRYILFTSNRSGVDNLWTVEVANPANKEQKTNLGANVSCGIWSPAGTQVVYADSTAGNDLYVATDPGAGLGLVTNPRKITSTGWNTQPNWGP